MNTELNLLFDAVVEVFALSTMLGVGLRVQLHQVLEPLKQLSVPLRALVANFILVPLLAIGIAKLLSLDSELSMGLYLISLCAGAPIVAKYTEMANGDLGFATALMIFLQLSTILLVPVLLPLSPWSLGNVTVDGLEVLQTLALSMFAPIIVGMLVRQYKARLAGKLAPWMARLSSVALLFLIVLGVGLNYPELSGLVGSHAFGAALLLIAGGWIIGWLACPPPNSKRVVFGLIGSSQNDTAALLIVAQEIEEPTILIMVLAFDVVMTVVNTGAALLAKRYIVGSRG